MRVMRRVTAILSVAAVILMAAGLAAQTKPSFAGEWKMATGELVGPEGDLIITQNATTMTLDGGDKTSAPGKSTHKLDGSMWAGNKLVVTTKTGAVEKRLTFSMEAGNLVVESSAPAAKVTYKRIVRGHGG